MHLAYIEDEHNDAGLTGSFMEFSSLLQRLLMYGNAPIL
jgi:hypothetical protein